MDRLNSGILKLTCPLLVSSVDLLEDDGFMKEINSKLVSGKEGVIDSEWTMCMDDAHKTHSATRKELIFGVKISDVDTMDDNSAALETLKSKLGERGAEAFLNSGVAGASSSASPVDVKCLHAWLADYLFRKVDTDENENTDGMAREHPIGEAIVEALKERGVDICGTDTCHKVCSGCSHSSKSSSSDASISVEVPIARNKQRRKRRQLQEIDTQ